MANVCGGHHILHSSRGALCSSIFFDVGLDRPPPPPRLCSGWLLRTDTILNKPFEQLSNSNITEEAACWLSLQPFFPLRPNYGTNLLVIWKTQLIRIAPHCQYQASPDEKLSIKISAQGKKAILFLMHECQVWKETSPRCSTKLGQRSVAFGKPSPPS